MEPVHDLIFIWNEKKRVGDQNCIYNYKLLSLKNKNKNFQVFLTSEEKLEIVLIFN